MKKILVALVSAALPMVAVPASSVTADEKVVVIIDTAVRSSQFPNVIHEVCITRNSSCLNNQASMEGKGAGAVREDQFSIKGIDHGNFMVDAAVKANPNTKVVFIRVTDVNSNKTLSSHAQSLTVAMQWVVENKHKFSIDAVSISQTSTTTCSANSVLQSHINALYAGDVPTFAAVGNNRFTDRVAFPACLPNVLGVAGTDDKDFIALYNNLGKDVDFAGLGQQRLLSPTGSIVNNVGSSVASPTVASIWVNRYSGSVSSQISKAKLDSRLVSDYKKLLQSYLIK
jgi:hypothetical protein